MTKPRHLRERQCQDCRGPFEARTDVARYCPACRWKHRGRRAKKYVWTEERLAYVREHYRAGIKGVPKTIASQWGWPDWVVKKKAAELGLTAAARYAENHRAWTAAEEALLRKHLGSRTPLWIAKKLGRSTTAVVMKVKHLNLSYALREGYTERRLMECFGVDHHTITRWIDAGKLRRRERPYSGRRALCLTNVDVLEFIQNHPDAFELSRVDQTWFMDLILGGGLLRRALWREADARRFSPPSAHRHSKERVA